MKVRRTVIETMQAVRPILTSGNFDAHVEFVDRGTLLENVAVSFTINGVAHYCELDEIVAKSEPTE